MKRALGYLAGLYARPDVQRALNLALLAAGAGAARRLFDDVHGRLERLEARGMVPRDDLATIGDVAKLEHRVTELEAEAELEAEPAGGDA